MENELRSLSVTSADGELHKRCFEKLYQLTFNAVKVSRTACHVIILVLPFETLLIFFAEVEDFSGAGSEDATSGERECGDGGHVRTLKTRKIINLTITRIAFQPPSSVHFIHVYYFTMCYRILPC